MEFDVRPLASHERRAASDAFRAALLAGPLDDATFAEFSDAWTETDSVAAWDGERCIGHSAAFALDTTVPGGARVATSGITRVGVLPTHTRRGVLRAMIERLLRDARDERAQPLASLRASEPAIYGRFGFGLAGDVACTEIDAIRARPLRGPFAAGAIELLDRSAILSVVPEVYDRLGRHRVGSISRPPGLWRRYMSGATAAVDSRAGGGEFVAVHRADATAEIDGYAHYSVEWHEGFGEPIMGVGEVHEVIAADPCVERTLWRFVLDVDLIRRWRSSERPVDDTVRRSFADYRAYAVKDTTDEQWVRVLDVDAALSARRFAPDVDAEVVIAVHDPLFADNCGRWRVCADGTRRTTTDRAADVSAPIAALSAAYLGGVSWSTLVAAGEATAADPRALRRADALFAVEPRPFCGSHF